MRFAGAAGPGKTHDRLAELAHAARCQASVVSAYFFGPLRLVLPPVALLLDGLYPAKIIPGSTPLASLQRNGHGPGNFEPAPLVGARLQCVGVIMKRIGWLAVIPFIGMCAGPVIHNSATPFILGMPFILAWMVAWVFLTSLIMSVIYWLDPERRADEETAQ
jgi:hypothetical protein